MSKGLKKKYDWIAAWERSLALAVSHSIIQPKPIGVWEFLIPVVFILTFMKNKQVREIFVQNLMFTKRLALDAAFDMLVKNKSRQAVFSKIEAQTRELVSKDAAGIYSDAIRNEQLNEIDLLIDHYVALLSAAGNGYAELAIQAYGGGDRYLVFHERLRSAEKKVNDAARQTLGQRADSMTLSKIENAIDGVRRSRIEGIFKNDAQQGDAERR